MANQIYYYDYLNFEELIMKDLSKVLEWLPLVYIFLFAYFKKDYFFGVISVVYIVLSIYLTFRYMSTYKANCRDIKKRIKKINKLEYYNFIDEKKAKDFIERKKVYKEVINNNFPIAFNFIFDGLAVLIIFIIFLGNISHFISYIFLYVLLFIYVLPVLIYCSFELLGFLYLHPTFSYISIPLMSFGLISAIYIGITKNENFNNYIFAIIIYFIYFVIGSFFYFLLSLQPAHFLRKLNIKADAISSIISIATAFILPVVKNDLSKIFRITSFTKMNDSFVLEFSFILATLKISYSLGKIIIRSKVKRNETKALHIFRESISVKSIISYDILKECAFYGGNKYENLLMINENAKAIIENAESSIQVPDTTWKNKLKTWWDHFINL